MLEDRIIMILGLQWNLFVYRRIQNGRNLKMDSMVRKLKYLAQSTKCTLYLAAGENITIKMSHVLCVWYIADLLWRCFQVRTLKCTEKTPIYIIQGIKNYSLAFFFSGDHYSLARDEIQYSQKGLNDKFDHIPTVLFNPTH